MRTRWRRSLKITAMCIAILSFSQIELRWFLPDDDTGTSAGRSLHRGFNSADYYRAPQGHHRLDNFSYTVTNDKINRFQSTLPLLLPEYKNPCWMEAWPTHREGQIDQFYKCTKSVKFLKGGHRTKLGSMAKILTQRMNSGERGRLRCFPDFFLLGVTKCGTTELFRALTKYGTAVASPLMKEPQYWGRRRSELDTTWCTGDAYSGFATYMDLFDEAAEVIRSNPTFDDNGRPLYSFITGDFSPTTLNMDTDWQERPGNEGLGEPAITTAHYIRHLHPGTRFIVIMRDPVERFYSNFRMYLRTNPHEIKDTVASTFRRAAAESVSQFRECRRRNSVRACAYTLFGLPYRHLVRGLYHVYIRDWMQVFPRHQFLFLSNEEFRANRLSTVKQLLDFLGLEALTTQQIEQIRQDELHEAAKIPKSYPPIDYSAEKMLREFYSPNIKELVKLIGNDVFNWTKNWA